MPRIGQLRLNGPQEPVGVYGWDGSTWQRLQVDANYYLKVALQAADGVDIGDVDVATINSVAPQFDDTDKMAISVYGYQSAAGDKPLKIGSGTHEGVVVQVAGEGLSGDATTSSPLRTHSQAGAAYSVAVHPLLFNGSTYDRQRNNLDLTLLASAARTATTSSADQTNYNARGVLVTLDVTAIVDTPSITLAIEAKDPVSGSYEKLLDAVAVTAVGTHTYIVYPGGGTAGDDVVEVSNFPLPRTWRVTVTHADTDSITYSVGGMLVL